MFIMNISLRIFSEDAEESGGDRSFPVYDSRCYFLRGLVNQHPVHFRAHEKYSEKGKMKSRIFVP